LIDQPAGHGRQRRRARLVTLGDLALDVVVRPGEPAAAGTDVAGVLEFRAGGSAANTARAFAALGGEASFIGAIGDDGPGRRLVRALRADGVRVHVTTVSRRPTARLAVLVDPRGERTFVTQRGAADWLRGRDVRAAIIGRSDALHLPAYSLLNEPLGSAATAAIGHARSSGRLVSIDLASRRPLLARGRVAARSLIAGAGPDLLFTNADEARALVGRDARRLLELAPIAVVKEGSAGCRVLWRAAAERSEDVLEVVIATKPLRTSDTTGAGDAFDAGFLHALLEHALAEGGRGSRSARAATGERVDRTVLFRRPQVLRRAAMGGHRAAATLLSRPRPELDL
jgi:sugar/nucleoside kinase (ribokinase family)